MIFVLEDSEGEISLSCIEIFDFIPHSLTHLEVPGDTSNIYWQQVLDQQPRKSLNTNVGVNPFIFDNLINKQPVKYREYVILK